MSNQNVTFIEYSRQGLVIGLSGHIDSSNADETEKMLLALRSEHPNGTVFIDAEKLQYISSAGLRVLMRLRKQEKTLEIFHVSSEVYEIFDLTGFTQILDIKKAMRKISVEGCEVIGEGGQGTVYRLDSDTIVKLYKPGFSLADIDLEQQCARKAFLNGIPTAISYDVVQCADSYGIVYEMIHSDTLSHAYKAHPEQFQELTAKYVQFVKDFHRNHIPQGTFERIQDRLHNRVKGLEKWCTEEELALLHSLIDAIPECDTPLHGDLHPGNIMIQNGELLLIDMPEISVGPAAYDLIGIFRDMISAPKSSPQVVEKSVGLPADTISAIGGLFFSMYTGLTDPKELQAYFQRMGLLYSFNVVLTVAAGLEVSAPFVEVVLNKLLRETVIPNAQTLRYLLANM